MSSEAKRPRKVNWTFAEVECLIDEVSSKSSLLFSSFSSLVTNKQKNVAWEDIARKVSACSSSQRSPADVKKKWTTLKSDTRKKAGCQKRAISQTGGGPPPPQLNEIEQKVVSLIPTCQIEGCVGGLESEDIETATIPEEQPIPVLESVVAPEEGENVEEEELLTSEIIIRPTKGANKSRSTKTSVVESVTSHGERVIQLEEEKMIIMREHLQVDRDRLQIEKEILRELRIMRENATVNSICVSPIIKL